MGGENEQEVKRRVFENRIQNTRYGRMSNHPCPPRGEHNDPECKGVYQNSRGLLTIVVDILG